MGKAEPQVVGSGAAVFGGIGSVCGVGSDDGLDVGVCGVGSVGGVGGIGVGGSVGVFFSSFLFSACSCSAC